MKTIRNIILFAALGLMLTTGSSCKVWRNVFGPKYGCPANGRSFGAERILSGEKVPKTKKFRA